MPVIGVSRADASYVGFCLVESKAAGDMIARADSSRTEVHQSRLRPAARKRELTFPVDFALDNDGALVASCDGG